jgi:hypothetical protein
MRLNLILTKKCVLAHSKNISGRYISSLLGYNYFKAYHHSTYTLNYCSVESVESLAELPFFCTLCMNCISICTAPCLAREFLR